MNKSVLTLAVFLQSSSFVIEIRDCDSRFLLERTKPLKRPRVQYTLDLNDINTAKVNTLK